MSEALEDWPKQWDEFRVELVEVVDASDTQVISVGRHHVRARDMEMEQEVFNVHTFRGDLLIRWDIYLTRSEALEAAGLLE
jgi:ketosteroid isomerase-like protein